MSISQVIIRTVLPSLSAIAVVGVFIVILNTHSIGDKLYNFLLKRKRIIYTFLIVSVLMIPMLFSLQRNELPSLQDLLLYVREIILSMIFILAFIFTWKILKRITSGRDAEAITNQIEVERSRAIDIGAIRGASNPHSIITARSSQRITSKCAANATAHAQSSDGTRDSLPPLPNSSQPISSRFSPALESVVGMYEAPQLLATQNLSAHQEDAPLRERVAGESLSSSTPNRQSSTPRTNANVPLHPSNSSDKHRKN